MSTRLGELRAVPWRAVGGQALVAGVLLVAAVGLRESVGDVLVWLGLGVLAAAAASGLDEPSAAVVAPTPTGRRRRTAQRLLVPAVLAGCWLASTTVLVAVAGGGTLSWPALAVTGLGVLLVAVAAADGMRRLGHDEPGAPVAMVVLAVVLGLVVLQPLPGGLVVLQAYEFPGRSAVLWAVLGAAAVTALWWSTVDPGALSRRRRRGRSGTRR
ncbi:hypothetical protein [Georgenia subflava]|uniref:Uncharacterized protein n=1 Tax=Georgenia subflava TaxID=1622177 RepID=A0A6N7EIW0_9MICO|nr:hypothetical protein [Georgenia subflava]MPV37361.1 hypothetical protein [Georgenia subflava]